MTGGAGNSDDRWIFDEDAPSTTAAGDLDGDGKCNYKARIASSSSEPPPNTNTWRMLCNDAWTDVSLSITDHSDVDDDADDDDYTYDYTYEYEYDDDGGTCSSGETKCCNGKCIDADYIRDSDNDCGDNSDETSQ